MRVLSRLFHREAPPLVTCPRCETPAPPDTITCTACGWDLRESYHDPVQDADRPATA